MGRDDLGSCKDPTAASLDPAALYLHAALQRVCGKLLLAHLSERKGLFLIVGAAGTGKTALLSKILAESPSGDCCVGLSGQAELSFEALVKLWCERLGISGEAVDEEARLADLRAYLFAQLDGGTTSALLLDNAECLQDEVLDGLRRISEWQTKRRKLVRIILAGRPELEARLGRDELSNLRKAVAFHAQLEPLKRWEVAAYIEHRLRVAGYRDSSLFSVRAAVSIARASGGVPRAINILCHSARLIAKRQSRSIVSVQIVEQAARDSALARQERESDPAALAGELDPAHDWPWPISEEPEPDEATTTVVPLSFESEPPRPPRLRRVVRSAAALFLGMLIAGAVVSFYPARTGLLDTITSDFLPAFDREGLQATSTDDASPAPRQPAGPTLPPAANSGGRSQTTLGAATHEALGDTASPPPTLIMPAAVGRPSLAVKDAEGSEGTEVPLEITAVPAESEGPQDLTITVAGVPEGAVLSAGGEEGRGAWSLEPDQLAGLALRPPENFSGRFELTIGATAQGAGGESVTAMASLAVKVAGVADLPSLTVADAEGNDGAAIPLEISAALADGDGSEKLSVSVAGLPPGATLSAGRLQGDNRWSLDPDELAGLALLPPSEFSGRFELTVAADAREADGDRATATTVLAVRIAGAATDTRPEENWDQDAIAEFLGFDGDDGPAADDAPSVKSARSAQTSPQPETKALMARGDKLLDLGDIAAARLFYELALDRGHLRAATAVGKTYDPLYLDELGVLGVPGNPDVAIEKYRWAIEVGDKEAETRLKALTIWLGR